VTNDLVIEDPLAAADTDYIGFLKVGSLRIKTNATRRNGTMDFVLTGTPGDLWNPAGVPAVVEYTARFREGSTVLFKGRIRAVAPMVFKEGKLELAVSCQDYTGLLQDEIVDPGIASGVRITPESDSARITWLIDTFANETLAQGVITDFVATHLTAMPDQDFTGMTLAEALDDICKFTGAVWYMDYTPALHYFNPTFIKSLTTPFGAAATNLFTSAGHGMVAGQPLSFVSKTGGTGISLDTRYFVIASGLTSNAFKVSLTDGGAEVDFTTNFTAGTFKLLAPLAPFGLSDTPDGSTTYGYANLTIPQESTELKNRVVVIGGNGFEDTFSDTVSTALYDVVRTGVIKDSAITNAGDAQERADAYFVDNAYHQVEGSCTVWQTGLEAGMDVTITSADQLTGVLGGDVGSSVYRITSLEVNYPRVGELSYQVKFGTPPRQLEHAIRKVAHALTPAEAYQIALDAVANNGGTSMPANPGTDTRFYRQDLGQWFRYDGTRWLSVELMQARLIHDVDISFTISGNICRAVVQFFNGTTDIWMEKVYTTFLVQSGGSALSGSHKWVGSALCDININSGSSNVWREDVQTINALLGSERDIHILWTKTGTPGNLYPLSVMTYRLVTT
jgi:hypothetical protein